MFAEIVNSCSCGEVCDCGYVCSCWLFSGHMDPMSFLVGVVSVSVGVVLGGVIALLTRD